MKDKSGQSRWKAPFSALKSALEGGSSKTLSEEENLNTETMEAESKASQTSPTPTVSASQPGEKCQINDDQARLAALYRVSRMLGASLDLDEVLAQVMDSVIGLTGAERGILVFTEGDPQNWTLRVARNIDEVKLSQWEKEVSRTIINTAIETRKGVVSADALADPRFSTQASVVFNVLRSTMCTPLLARGRVIGAIYVDSRIQKGIFEEKDLEMLDAFAFQAAYAIDNARIYTRTVQQMKQLKIELDEARKDRQVAEITETEYFQRLRARVEEMRRSSKGKED